jgi:hypothetical protein
MRSWGDALIFLMLVLLFLCEVSILERLLLSIPFELEPRRLYTRVLKYLGASWPLELGDTGGCLPRWPSSPINRAAGFVVANELERHSRLSTALLAWARTCRNASRIDCFATRVSRFSTTAFSARITFSISSAVKWEECWVSWISKTSDAARECLSLSNAWHLAARDDIRRRSRSLGTNVYSLLARADRRSKRIRSNWNSMSAHQQI